MQDLVGKVAVVTGAGSGIGRGIALGLAAEEMTVAVADIRAESAAAVVKEIVEAGGRGFAVSVDVTSVESLELAAKQVAAEAGGANLLCANAGVLARIASLDEHTIEDWEYTLSVNVLGVVKTVKAFLPLLRERAPDAHIVNTASLGGLMATEGFPIGAYIASKYACVGYSEMLRGELAGEGIGVSVLCPGVVASDLVNTSMRNRPESFGEQPAPGFSLEGGEADTPAPSVTAMPAEDVGPMVVNAVRANRLHVLTHPETWPVVEKRFRTIEDDYEFAAKEKAKGALAPRQA
ncbi:MAG: SDR family NAD(P)-dependent oxidoreductase [Deltaproteobacteria bacterium]|nr:SDR family NAD(P)-dependent oxidoreductase [Deltaproteobacteria bacterium]